MVKVPNSKVKKTSIRATQKKARALFLFIIGLFLISTVPSLTYLGSSGILEKRVLDPVRDFLFTLEEAEKVRPPVEELGREIKTETKTNVEIQINDDKIQVTERSSGATGKECYRYTVTHLDGSTSSLCYSKTDYEQLRSLGFELSSAKTFYEFYLEAVQNYQDQYEITGSDIYLDAKESSQRKADQEKEKIGQITLQMQQIEERGY